MDTINLFDKKIKGFEENNSDKQYSLEYFGESELPYQVGDTLEPEGTEYRIFNYNMQGGRENLYSLRAGVTFG